MPKLTIIYWRDIPAQVMAKERRQSAKVQLTPRFEAAIDRSAMRAKMSAADDYIGEWRRGEAMPCGDDMDKAVAQTAAKIEAEYTDEKLQELIQNKGFATVCEE